MILNRFPVLPRLKFHTLLRKYMRQSIVQGNMNQDIFIFSVVSMISYQ